ncbi:MAG: hypothetical protein ACREOG_14760 [Gemmatimonadaceae bacterium]
MHFSWWGAWAAGYVAVLIFVGVRAALGRGRERDATFCSGRFLFAFTMMYAAAAVVATLLGGRNIPVAVLFLIAALAIATWLSRAHALVVGEAAARTTETTAGCARRLCLTGERTVAGYRFALPGGALVVRLRAVGALATLISLHAKPPHRKAELFAKLIAKQYRGPLPVIRIRMR